MKNASSNIAQELLTANGSLTSRCQGSIDQMSKHRWYVCHDFPKDNRKHIPHIPTVWGFTTLIQGTENHSWPATRKYFQFRDKKTSSLSHFPFPPPLPSPPPLASTTSSLPPLPSPLHSRRHYPKAGFLLPTWNRKLLLTMTREGTPVGLRTSLQSKHIPFQVRT